MSKLSDEIGQFASIPHTVIKMCPEITADGLALFTYLRYRTNHDTGDAFPSYDTIQKDTGMSRRRIARALRALIDAGVATRKRRFSGSTIYSLVMPKPPISRNAALMDSSISSSVALPLVAMRHTNKIETTKKETKKKKDRATPSKQRSEPHPNTQPLMAAFVECLPERARPAFDYAAAGRKAKRLAAMGIEPKHIAPYFRMIRAQWDKSPKMKDKPVTFYDLADFIEARAQHAGAEPGDAPAQDFSAYAASATPDDVIAAQDADRAARHHEVVPGSAEDVWARALDTLRMTTTKATFDVYLADTRAIERHNGTLTVEVGRPQAGEWLALRMKPVIERAVRAAAGADVQVQYVTKGA